MDDLNPNDCSSVTGRGMTAWIIIMMVSFLDFSHIDGITVIHWMECLNLLSSLCLNCNPPHKSVLLITSYSEHVAAYWEP